MRGDFRTEPPISGIIGVDSHGIPVYQVGGGIFAGTIDFHCVGDIRLRLGDGRGDLREEPRRPRPYSRGGRGDIAIQGVARRFLTATGRMPPRARIWAMRQRGAARHAATNALRRLIHRGLPVRDGGFRPRGLGADARGIKMRFLGLAGARATPNRISRALRGRNPTLRHRCGRRAGRGALPLCD